ncbi:MAG: hypothetical protein ACFB00_00345 [Parvularculaceae bacterium]
MKKDINARRADNADRLGLAFVVAAIFGDAAFAFRAFALLFGVLFFVAGEAFAGMREGSDSDV